jgi:elongation factor G
MSKHTTADVRNFALIGGPGTGKTSLAEALLVATGALPRPGTVEEGTTASDFLPEEKEKQHSIALGLLYTAHKGRSYGIADAPGYPDYQGEAAAAVAACETAVLCIDAGAGLTFPGRTIWSLAGKARRARCVVVTGLDKAELDWQETVDKLSESLGVRCLPMVLPNGTGSKFEGVTAVPLGGGGEGTVAAAAEVLVEAVVEIDEAVMTRFLEEDVRPDAAETAKLLTRSMVAGDVVPVLCVNSLESIGVEEFLEFADTCLPSPADGPFFRDTDGNDVTPSHGGVVAFVFKTQIDAYVGRLSHLRIVAGEVETAQPLHNPRTEKAEKLAAMQQTQGKDHKLLESAIAGDIVTVAKLEHLETSDTLCDQSALVVIEPLHVPAPMVARAIVPADHGDEVKLSTALKRAAAEDPTFLYERDESTGELIAHGISIVHLESVLRRIKERSNVEVKASIPRVPLRETVTSSSSGHHRHKKQTGGRGQFAEVFLKVTAAKRGEGLLFVDGTVGGSIPRQFIPAIEKGVRTEMARGVIAGYPVVDVEVKISDGKYHDVDSDEASFKLAGGRAFRDGFLKSHPVLLEPLLDMEIAIPARFMGAITSDITGRRGHITGMDSLGEIQVVKARVPQREVLTYPTALRSLTSGEGSFTAAMHDYDVVPGNIQQEIMAGFKLNDDA